MDLHRSGLTPWNQRQRKRGEQVRSDTVRDRPKQEDSARAEVTATPPCIHMAFWGAQSTCTFIILHNLRHVLGQV